jgi:pimeloyl-ACP methyl ester carboxylesterase
MWMYVLYGVLFVLAAILIYLFRFSPKLPPETDAIIDRVMQNELPELVTGETGYAMSSGVRIWYERISPQGVPRGTILLIMSNGASALEWPQSFLETYVDAGYRVVRFDHRGTGLSDLLKDWSRKNPYSVADMATDAIAVLDALSEKKAHVIGLSMGGMVAQEVAIQSPERVASLTLLMTSGDVGDPDLPGLTSRYILTQLFKGLPLLQYRLRGGEKNLIKERVAKMVAMGDPAALNIQEMAEIVLYDERNRTGVNISAAFQHQMAVTISGSRHEKLKQVNVPTLVMHGTADQLMPVEHGKKLVESIAGAKGLWIEGMGHIWPFPDMPRINEAILSHLRDVDAGH